MKHSVNMESEWNHFRSVDIAPTAPDVQVFEMRKAFYSGIASGVKLGLEHTPDWNLEEMKRFIAAEDSRRRLARIERLMMTDPTPDSADGKELNALVDQQMEAEKHIEFPASGDEKHG